MSNLKVDSQAAVSAAPDYPPIRWIYPEGIWPSFFRRRR